MKRIKFDNLQTSWFFISLIVLSLVCIIFGFFEIIQFDNPIINKRISAIGYASQAVFFSRMFWYKNYLQWNKKGMVIRINSFFGKSISFETIERTKLENHILTIYKNDGKSFDFDLSDIEENDSKKLNDIINQYCC
ncbi:hypothetical protein SAMN05444395_10825 [Flavobacterium fryxellicola]|uniref:Uncharacterized protein n=1 Tax=Flavobacterium fryxellicola TaxID=249352 RepID=A0A167UIV1_9FLAO|nr:hypothetical protein [Flavobacterium fryxellicola]OAB25636.1 hypothetical protein FBFR_14105 [Flavobacterium fryxellicola]SHN73775.1 hypothetical protein SAMN05444395_10825 [Flavobacterium fryxellicola]